ncbi:transmembrane protein, putative [Medicago truncatula]|uniref:Transmembrane protein, putative n=1 Tax=Medicago truncatula TaxID=3880 RepID=G7J3C3_MEDTR|nr:transmembrane protein, putative [Medicago truncatula]
MSSHHHHHSHLSFAFGVLGNITSSPSLVQCYAYEKTGETLLITINTFGCVIETFYLAFMSLTDDNCILECFLKQG